MEDPGGNLPPAAPVPEPPELPLTQSQRVVYGGVGGLTPYIVKLTDPNFIVAFQQSSITDLTYSVPGFLVNSTALFFIGAFVVILVLHYRETSAWKAFVTGIGAPALISGLVHNIPIQPASSPSAPVASPSPSAPGASPSRRGDTLIIARAFAQDELPSYGQPVPNPNRLPTAQVFCVPRQTPTQLFLSGVIGRPPILFDDLLWVVLRQRFDTLEGAQQFVKDFNQEVNPNNRNGIIKPRIVMAERSETGRFWIAFGVWLTEKEVSENWALFLEASFLGKASSLFIDVLPFSVIRGQFGYNDIRSVPSCVLASRG
jgi:hypothetical protein